MEIEFIGCTGAGKSSLVGGMLRVARARGIDVSTADDYVLRRWQLHRLRGRLARTLAIDVLALIACARSGRNDRAFLRFAVAVVRRLPVGAFQKANIVRNVAKQIGIHAMVRRYRRGGEFVLVDEGTLQCAHYLFAHVAAGAAVDDMARFAMLVPLPDVVVYVTEDERVLVERTLRRGHARIPARSAESVRLFVSRAVVAFEVLWREAVRARRIVVADGDGGFVIGTSHAADAVRGAVDLVHAAGRARYRSAARGPSGFSPRALSRRLANLVSRPSHER